MRIVAIFNGGDWYDASVDHLVVPEGVDLEEEKRKRREWYDNVYVPANFPNQRAGVEYMSLVDWLIARCGARRTDDSEVEEFWEAP